MMRTLWPNLRLYARDCGVVEPYDAANAALFRGEAAFARDVEGWRRWSKPSPEPRLDADFEPILLNAINVQAPIIGAMARDLARQIIAANEDAPIVVAILRAGVPIGALLCPLLESYYGAPIPLCAFSMFYGLGWDDAALARIIADFPDRPLVFVDGWTSGGGVATQLKNSFDDWKARGQTDFARGGAPQFAVLCDPRGAATYSALRADCFVPSAAFTAPETLGFSRGFAFEDGELFGVYAFPPALQKPLWIAKWMEILEAPPAPIPSDDATNTSPAPNGFRVHVNEVIRALINRDPHEIWLRPRQNEAERTLAPLLYLAKKRGVPVEFGRADLGSWGALAVARMK